jgi:wyosine [tRNA(Phe)-imidazoG37] synthetase (radical SAM superfamily)
MTKLVFSNHSRSFEDYTYVYPVVSRRANGVSLGINLNINNACNWRCIYCQVENLIRDKPSFIDLDKIEKELDHMLNWIINGNFIKKFAPDNLQRFNDISLSGNGEPTLSPEFGQVVTIIAKLRQKYHLDQHIKTILITNGSEVSNPSVVIALKLLAQNNGEIWFKIDAANENTIKEINQVNISLASIKKHVILANSLCKTYIQTCIFKQYNQNPPASVIQQYVDFIISIRSYIAGVLLYSTARNRALPEGQHISSVSAEFLIDISQKLEQHQINVKYYP